MKKKAFLDVSISICPRYKAPYADASWYAISLASNIDCGVCGNSWSPKKSQVDRLLLEFLLDKDGNVIDIKKKQIEDK
ncbi:MAG: hypothetical protein JSW60_04295 [Thermoplasmatales archaeon]|nr:MAG: hypothetical protein JSW60_04295 [Thermoplasmatales archaeon]